MCDIRVSANKLRCSLIEGEIHGCTDSLVQIFWVGDSEVQGSSVGDIAADVDAARGCGGVAGDALADYEGAEGGLGVGLS